MPPDQIRQLVLASDIAIRIADAYNNGPVRAAEVAKACDEVLDPSGNLLGWVRELAAMRKGTVNP